jgi:voltage-gated potassium channel
MYKKLKKDIRILLHPELGNSKWDKFINAFIITLIVLNVVAVMLETVHPLYDNYKSFFDAFDWVSVIIFTIEYVLRVWSCNSDPKFAGPVKGRIKYMMTGGALIDLLAFLPGYLHHFLNFDLRVLRILRLLRFLRLFRLTAYTKSAQLILNVFRSRFNELVLSFILSFFLVIIASCLVYFAEHHAQPDKFSSIPATIWWAIVSLTTTGYGDLYPITVWGKVFASVVLMAGVALLALPAGIITTGFLEEMRIIRRGKSYKCPHCGGDITKHVHKHHLDEE